MSFYNLNTDYVGEQLTPPKLRTSKFLAWLKVLLKPLNRFMNIDFDFYMTGATCGDYDNTITYSFGDNVIGSDKCVYECIVASSLGVNVTNTTNWIKLNSNFIGANERVKYNAQIMLFEYALNKYFRVAALPADQIYITNNTYYTDHFVMGNTGTYSSTMPTNSVNQIHYLGNTYTYSSSLFDYTIYVPVAIFNGLGTNTANRENAIRNFANQYNLAGMVYNVVTY
jgi:hypothetical protein